MKVFKVALKVKISFARAVIHHQTPQRADAFLDPVEGVLEPGALGGIFQIDAP